MPKIEIPEGDSVETVLTEQEIAQAESTAEDMKGIDFTKDEEEELLKSSESESGKEIVKWLAIRGLNLKLTDEVLRKLKSLSYKLTESEKTDIIDTIWEMIAPEENPPAEDGFPTSTLKGLAPKDQEWLYPNILPRGKFCLLAAEPGAGKTSLCAYFTIQMYKADPTIRTGFLSFEDDTQQFVNKGINADYEDRVFLYATDSMWVNGKGLKVEDSLVACKRVLSFIFRKNLDIVFIDTIQKLLNVDANRYDIVSECLVPLVKICDKIGCNITCITHFNKSSAKVKDTVILASLIMGSQAWNGTVRNALAIWRDRTNDIRALEVVKSQLGNEEDSWQIISSDNVVVRLDDKGKKYATKLASGHLNKKVKIPEAILDAVSIFGERGRPFTIKQFQDQCGNRQALNRWFRRGYGDLIKVDPADYPDIDMEGSQDLFKFADDVNSVKDLERIVRDGRLNDALDEIANDFHKFEQRILDEFGSERFTLDQLKELGLYEQWQSWVRNKNNNDKFEQMPIAKRLFNRPTFRLVPAAFPQQMKLMGIRDDEKQERK